MTYINRLIVFIYVVCATTTHGMSGGILPSHASRDTGAIQYATGDAPHLPFRLPDHPHPTQTKVQALTTPRGGYPVWLYEHQESPLVTIKITFLRAGFKNESLSKGGKFLMSKKDPSEGTKGLTNLLKYMLMEGAGSYSGKDLKKILLENHIRLTADDNEDTFSLVLSMPYHKIKKALELVHIILTQPRFDSEDLRKIQDRLRTEYKNDLESPMTQGFLGVMTWILGDDHPYSRPTTVCLDQLDHITPNDLRDYIQDHFTQDSIAISVCGPIGAVPFKPDALSQQDFLKSIDDCFDALPKNDTAPKIEKAPLQNLGSIQHIPMDIPQTTIFFVHPGFHRSDPDFMGMELAIDVLGSGQFGSRLMQRIREKQGLVYSISMAQWARSDDAFILGSAATRSEHVNEVIEMIRTEWANLIQHGITDKEFKAEQQRLIACLPLWISSSEGIAHTLSTMQYYNLGSDYLHTREALLKGLKRDRINMLLKERLKPEHLTFITVGRAPLTPAHDAPHSDKGVVS